MIIATQAEVTVLGWYYIPVIMLSAALSIAVALVTNNIQRRYPVYWIVPGEIPLSEKASKEAKEIKQDRKESENPLPPMAPISPTLTPGDSQVSLGKVPTLVEHENNVVIVTAQDVFLPSFLELEDENLKVLEEIQRLIREHIHGDPDADGRTLNGENAV